MNSVVYINCSNDEPYDDYRYTCRLMDRLKIKLMGENFISELGINVAKVKFPPNFNKQAYMNNLEICKRYGDKKHTNFAPKTFRKMDYHVMTDYQKNLFAYSVVQSVQLVLRLRKKSIKNACIAVYDAAEDINEKVLYELSKECKYIVLLSGNLLKSRNIGDYITANYGVAPVVTNDIEYVLKSADFIITSKSLNNDISKPLWCIDNRYVPNSTKSIIINDVSFNVPWEIGDLDMSVELLGAILGIMEEKDIEKSLKYNGIMLDKIMFNNVISF